MLSFGTSFGLELQENFGTLALFTISLVLLLFYGSRKYSNKEETNGKKYPPHIPSSLPFLGHAVSFGKSPLEFLLTAYKQYGPVFSFTMVGKTFTYLIGSDAATVFFNSRNDDLNAEEVYSRLITPVFGAGVAYDCPHSVFLEQKKMFKTGLNIERFRSYIPIIVEETRTYFKKWGDSGQKDLFQAFSQLIILTASACLHGPEIRAVLDESVAQLYWDLDGGFSAEAWLLPPWLPLPSFRRRDAAHKKVKQIFYNVIKTRRESEVKREDMLQTLLDSTYKSGRSLSDDEVAGMLIGLLLAGQHTSSSTSTWLGLFLAANKHLQTSCASEQRSVFGTSSNDVDYDGLKECELLERCIKETLRLRPPIMTMMRMCKTTQEVNGYTIPPGHQVCVSPTTNHTLPDVWTNPAVFDPDRFLSKSESVQDQKFSYIPFGAGRHRCIGETFAYVQIKTIWSTLLREYEFDLVDGHFPEINFATMIHTPKSSVITYKRRSLEK